MKVTVEIPDDWFDKAVRSFGEDGTNDEEHDLLVDIVDAVSFALDQTWVPTTDTDEFGNGADFS